ncbi:MAG: endolytic transglycosylase MltG [Chitinivibrionales bacterium]|nr:endolytic transglycosylase MltG [Chitinivibrionales bacterium]
MVKFYNYIFHLWFTGLLYIAAFLGYIFYGLLWALRFMQKYLRATVIIIVAAVLIGAGVFMYYFSSFGTQDREIELVIEPGTSLKSIAGSLEKKGVVKSDAMLLLWLKINDLDTKVKAGKCIFLENEGIIAASRKLLDAQPIEISATVREGLTIEQTARVFAKTFPIDTTKFLALCRSDSFTSRFSIPSGSVEGYLFPDTYFFPEEVSAGEIIDRMLDRFERAWSNLDFSEEIKSKYSMHEIVTMASIVEREATLPEERPRIAGVFYNRLRLGYPLGADPTVRYLLRKFSGPLRVSELNTSSPYNTRKYPGLPPGPICSPGASSLQASVSPMDTKELYFVAKWDGSGAHDFSVTGAEHERKKRKIRRMNEKRKRAQK